MSRYKLVPKDKRYEVAVGYDNPLETFFATVIDLEKDEEEADILWLGGTPGEVKQVTELIEPLKPYADIPNYVLERMLEDYEARTEPSFLQRFALRAFKNALDEEAKNVHENQGSST